MPERYAHHYHAATNRSTVYHYRRIQAGWLPHARASPVSLARRTRAAAASAAAAAAGDITDEEFAEMACERFIAPNKENGTFFSPLDPRAAVSTYPPKLDCTFVLEAPVGFVIKLDFRNVFNIEPSPGCEFDYLEVSVCFECTSNLKNFNRN